MFRFTLRDLLWLIVVVAMGCVVLVERRRAESYRRESDDFKQRETNALGLMNVWRDALEQTEVLVDKEGYKLDYRRNEMRLLKKADAKYAQPILP